MRHYLIPRGDKVRQIIPKRWSQTGWSIDQQYYKTTMTLLYDNVTRYIINAIEYFVFKFKYKTFIVMQTYIRI